MSKTQTKGESSLIYLLALSYAYSMFASILGVMKRVYINNITEKPFTQDTIFLHDFLITIYPLKTHH